MTSQLEDTFAFQLDAAGLTGYVREFAAIPGRKFRFDFCFRKERLLIEINGGVDGNRYRHDGYRIQNARRINPFLR